MQLTFGQDAILNTKFEANWAFIKEQKQKRIRANNKQENAKRTEHTYRVHDKVLLKRDELSKYNYDPWEGPYEVVQVHDNGTLSVRMGAVTDILNIRLIKPYKE